MHVYLLGHANKLSHSAYGRHVANFEVTMHGWLSLLHMLLFSLRRLQRPLLVPSILNCKIISHYLFHYICPWFSPIKHISRRWDEEVAIEADPEINCLNPSHECEWRNHSSEVLYYGRYRKVYFPWLRGARWSWPFLECIDLLKKRSSVWR